ncbi:MAG: radical SAM protein [Desulfurococcales archaeon]|nr:radical SAM protein [Desulfurococcales archaeon]
MRFREGELIRLFDPWSNPLCTCPRKYTLNPYTGCSFFCVYCYATAYVGRKPSTPKKNYFHRLLKDLRKIDPELPINMSTSSDPYPPIEKNLMITRRTLQLLIKKGLRVLITTKGTLYTRDVDIMKMGVTAITPTITTLDDSVSSKLEPRAPSPKERIKALERISDTGIPAGVRIDPILPYINDDPQDIEELVAILSQIDNVDFIVTSTYKAKPDNLKRVISAFPELAEKYRQLYLKEGIRVRGYWYLKKKLRLKLLKPIFIYARKYGLRYAHCREGLQGKEYFNSPSCDGTHLLYPPYYPAKIR